MYLYENLGDERFQEFCQALLLPEYPGLQCFPVGQPDGGRDGLSRLDDTGTGPTVVQVKFKRRDEAVNAQWLINALEGELPKIERLIAQGATKYILMTNARGTAHGKSGSIDKVNAWLTENVPIDSMIMWRDDVDRRVDAAPVALKLKYPAILTGDDVLAFLVATQMGPDNARIGRALRAFVAEQFRKDENVKFRQVELANSLLALFVDVPLDASQLLREDKRHRLPPEFAEAVLGKAYSTSRDSTDFDVESDYDGPNMLAGTADMLLDAAVQREVPWILLHGAPGQGKSTIAQYVSQVHRGRYLNRAEFLSAVDPEHLNSPFRLPLKIDLRDFAEYLAGRDYLNQPNPDLNTARTLERFMASLISVQSGGLDFSANDLLAALLGTPVLIFFDGLDEVGDLALRKNLVDSIGEGLNRLRELQIDLQVVVTSRPSLFGSAPPLPKSFLRLDLAPLDEDTIVQYADKWVGAKNLEPESAEEVTGILSDKLDAPHIRELTKNPMQLSILLSLILSKGHSLPEARTDLYREYIKLFMAREAEKSSVVREHQQLLLSIVEYLAWLLQSRAEAEGAAGSISGDDIRTVIAEYLQRAEHEFDIIDDLFNGGLERVYVLVQRIEGLYEFEVQPLREYFAAKYLYSSAPVRNFRIEEVSGDRAERFEAIAANPYWANVTRFYAGFYEDGELGALLTSLREMVGSDNFQAGVNARSIGATLLSDWVFSAKKIIQRDVVTLVFDDVGMELAARSLLPGFEKGALDRQCGRDVLRNLLFDRLKQKDSRAEMMIAATLRRNGGAKLVEEFAEWISSSSGSARTTRIALALAAGAFSEMAAQEAESLLWDDHPNPKEERSRLSSVMAQEEYLLSHSARIARRAFDSAGMWGGRYLSEPATSVGHLWASLFERAYRRLNTPKLPLEADDARLDATTLGQLRSMFSTSGSSRKRPPRWNDPLVIDHQIQSLRQVIGDCWGLYQFVIWSVGNVKTTEAKGLDDTQTSLLGTALRARAERGASTRWLARIRDSQGPERLFWLGMLLAWGTSRNVEQTADEIEPFLDALEEDDFERLCHCLAAAFTIRNGRNGRVRNFAPIGRGVGERTAIALIAAFGPRQIDYMDVDDSSSSRLQTLREKDELEQQLRKMRNWAPQGDADAAEWLEMNRRARQLGVMVRMRPNPDDWRMDINIAETIIEKASSYPAQLVAVATSAVTSTYEPRAVLEIAQAENWAFA